jgi:predicted membrane-bound mannosyltransferase
MEITHEVDYERTKPSRLDLPFLSQITLNWETVLFATILVLAFTTRIYDLGIRVMSHDETSHVYFSWRLYKGEGYQHDPVTHGPLQFHLLALSYFLIGDSDFSARLPAA